MKKAKFTLAVLLLVILSSCSLDCAYKEYSGEYTDLYTVTVNSVLWVNGYSWGTDFKSAPQIEKIGEDNYGRAIFFLSGKALQRLGNIVFRFNSLSGFKR